MTFRGIFYLFITIIILVNVLYFKRMGYLLWDANGKLQGYVADWDLTDGFSMLNELRHGFFPRGHHNFPGELPYYNSWLGFGMFPVFLFKYLGLDRSHAYFFWSPLFYYVALITLIHYFIRLFTKDKWLPLFSLGLLFMLPDSDLFIRFGSWNDNLTLRALAGIFFFLTLLYFIRKYFIFPRQIYVFLAICTWSLLYVVKGNFAPATIGFIGSFLVYVLIHAKEKADYKTILVLIPSVVLLFFLFWFSRYYFGYTSVPTSGGIFSYKLASIARRISSFQILIPVVLTYVIFFWKRLKAGEKCSAIERIIGIGTLGMFLFVALARHKIEGQVDNIIVLILFVPFPYILQKLLPRPILIRTIFGGLILVLSFLLLFKKSVIKHVIPITDAELEVINYIRTQTPEGSAIFYTIPRYNDRPAIMSALTYRKSFITEAERHSEQINLSLERRLYDYWDFLLCDCSKEDREYFFKKYPYVKYVVEYGKTFGKEQNSLIGGGGRMVVGLQLIKKDPKIFEKVFHKENITVYKINHE